jgi:Asp-tRNA(Asn)/Glu-tRNA(Gln) amidotransferase A subunit family amidase
MASDIPAEIGFLTIAEASRLIERKKLSPVELTSALVRRAELLDPQINAYLLPTSEKALAQARDAEQEIMAGAYRGAMHGIPFGLKDIYSTAGVSHDRSFEDLHRYRPLLRCDDRNKALRRWCSVDGQARDP